MAFQDFTTYTETDPTSKITVTSTKIDVAAIPEEDDAFVVKDFGASHFTDFDHDFEVYIDSATTNGIHAIVWGVSNAADMVSTDANAKLFVRAYDDTTPELAVGDQNNQVSVTVSNNTLYYCTVVRSGTTLTLSVYSDSGRTSLVGSNNLTVVSTAFRYLYGFANYGNAVGAFTWTGYSQNFDINEGGGGGGRKKFLTLLGVS